MEASNQTDTIGQMVAMDYRKADVFKKYKIDFCCAGNRTLEAACASKNVDIEEVAAALQALESAPQAGSQDFNRWELDFLIDYIVNTHHKYVAESLPLIKEYSQKVARVHGEHHPEVVEIATLVQAVADELQMHMFKEEQVLFPYIKKMVQAKKEGEPCPRPPFGAVANPITMMETEHESAGSAFESMRTLTNGFVPPDDACATFQVLYAKLNEFENDLHQHVHLENNILFPKSKVLESELMESYAVQ